MCSYLHLCLDQLLGGHKHNETHFPSVFTSTSGLGGDGSLYSPVHLTLTSQYLSTWVGYKFLKLCLNLSSVHFHPKKMDVKFLILQMDI